MPELLEVERYRRAAEAVLGPRVIRVEAPDGWFLKGCDAPALIDALYGRSFIAARRIGKLLVLDTDGGPALGLRFGMTGRLLVDGSPAVERLQHSSGQDQSAWRRFGLHFHGGASLHVLDPRRLGGVSLEPDERRLGPDAWSVTPAQLRAALQPGSAPLKARLLDQARLAGLGNLLCDEILWRAGLDPARPAASLDDRELRRMHRHLRATLGELYERGGSHTGRLQAARFRGGLCPKDSAPLERRTIGGRTTYSCPRHQL